MGQVQNICVTKKNKNYETRSKRLLTINRTYSALYFKCIHICEFF